MANLRVCSIPDCGKPILARGWCNRHWLRWSRHGDPLSGGFSRIGEPAKFLKEVVLPYKGDDCLFWPFYRDANGYARFDLDGKNQIASRIVCTSIQGEPPSPKYDAAHSCGNGHLGCVTPRHLSWKTRSENIADMTAHGTICRGEKRSKLSESDVRTIRSLPEGTKQKDVAAKYGVSIMTVSNVVLRKTWAWLD